MSLLLSGNIISHLMRSSHQTLAKNLAAAINALYAGDQRLKRGEIVRGGPNRMAIAYGRVVDDLQPHAPPKNKRDQSEDQLRGRKYAPQIAKWLSGETAISPPSLERLSKATGKAERWLVSGEGPEDRGATWEREDLRTELAKLVNEHVRMTVDTGSMDFAREIRNADLIGALVSLVTDEVKAWIAWYQHNGTSEFSRAGLMRAREVALNAPMDERERQLISAAFDDAHRALSAESGQPVGRVIRDEWEHNRYAKGAELKLLLAIEAQKRRDPPSIFLP